MYVVNKRCYDICYLTTFLATYDATGAVDFLDVFDKSGDDYGDLTVFAGTVFFCAGGGRE